MRKRTETRVSLRAQWLRGRKSPVRVNHLRPSDKSNLVRPCINVIFLGSLVSVLAPSIYSIAVYLSRRELWQFGLEVREARWQLGPRTHTLRAGHVEISRASCSHGARQSSSDIFFFFTKPLHSHLAVGSQGHAAIVEALLVLCPQICTALATTSCFPTRPLFVY